MWEYQAQIVSVHDGDTFRADIDLGFGAWLKNVPLRVYGIDCPEIATDAGKVARDAAKALLPAGARVTMRTHKGTKDKYGRYLGQITMDNGDDYATAMVAANHAKTYDGGSKQ